MIPGQQKKKGHSFRKYCTTFLITAKKEFVNFFYSLQLGKSLGSKVPGTFLLPFPWNYPFPTIAGVFPPGSWRVIPGGREIIGGNESRR
jgi:hypothetical protein